MSVFAPMFKTADGRRGHIRWMIQRDFPEVLAIEQDVFEFPWHEAELLKFMRSRFSIGMVAEVDDRVAGHMAYVLHKRHLEVATFAVRFDHWRRRIGRAMVEKLVGKLSWNRRSRINLVVRERNVGAQLFFRDCGFKALRTLRSYYDSCLTDEDGIAMCYRLPVPSSADRESFTADQESC